jgi:ribosomal protein S26
VFWATWTGQHAVDCGQSCPRSSVVDRSQRESTIWWARIREILLVNVLQIHYGCANTNISSRFCLFSRFNLGFRPRIQNFIYLL